MLVGQTVGLGEGKIPGKQFCASSASWMAGKVPCAGAGRSCTDPEHPPFCSRVWFLGSGPAWQGVWVLVYCLDGPEHPEKQGEKGLTQPAPLPLTYFMWLRTARGAAGWSRVYAMEMPQLDCSRFPGAGGHFQSAWWPSHSLLTAWLHLQQQMRLTWGQGFSKTQAVQGPEQLDITLAAALHLFPPKFLCEGAL